MQGQFTVTAYCAQDTGNGTSTGADARHIDGVAVDPHVVPYGSRVYIPGVGVRTADDCGGAIKGNRLDVRLKDHDACMQWGRRELTVTIYRPGENRATHEPQARCKEVRNVEQSSKSSQVASRQLVTNVDVPREKRRQESTLTPMDGLVSSCYQTPTTTMAATNSAELWPRLSGLLVILALCALALAWGVYRVSRIGRGQNNV